MDALWSYTTPQDMIALGMLALVPVLMVIAICLIRSEIRQAAGRAPAVPPRPDPLPLQLKTTEAQRAQWRMGKQRHPHAISDLTDDIETLLKRVEAGG